MRKTILLALTFLFITAAPAFSAERHPLKKFAGKLRATVCRSCR